MSSIFGTLFKVTTFGESHGVAIGCVIDGCPAQIPISKENIQQFLDRRRPGQNQFTTTRAEKDQCEILSGIENNITLGSPICIIVRNQDKVTSDYSDINSIFRPSHADYTTFKKYGIISVSGGGRSSARETVGRVAAGAVAKAYVKSKFPDIEILAWVNRIANIEAHLDEDKVTFDQIENSEIRCPDPVAEIQMKDQIFQAKQDGDTVGGQIRCVIRNAPAGLGEPVFNKFEANLSKAMLSIPACKYFESGDGIQASYSKGSENNDEFYADENGKIATRTNHSGGIQGGISNGMSITFSAGFKPVSTLFKEQNTTTRNGKNIQFTPKNGRHDSCVLPRAVPIVESMSWLVLADHIRLMLR
jgi:chorismate synthase